MFIPATFGEIRPYRRDDAEALANHANNRKVWLNMRDAFPHPYSLEHAQAFLDMVAAQNPLRFFAIATNREIIGGIGVTRNEDVHRFTAELGYWLAEPYWGRGVMTEAVAKFTDYVFDQFGLMRIYAEPYAENAASCRVLEKAGYTLEGRLRASVVKEGRVLDQLLYAQIRAVPSA